MFSLIKDLFTSSPDKILDMASGAGNFIDESFHTDEEKAKANQKKLDWYLRWVDSTQGMNKARRFIAIAFTLSFLFTFLLGVYALALGFGFGYDTKPFLDALIDWVDALQIGWIMVCIVAFYFTGGIVGKPRMIASRDKK